MRVELTGRHVEISPGLRNLVDRKLAKIVRVLNDAGVSAAVVLTKQKINKLVEITLHARGEHFMHATGRSGTWETAMTAVTTKLLHQAEKVKGKWHERTRRGEAARSVKVPRAARKAVSRKAAPVTGGAPASERRAAAAAKRTTAKRR